MNKHRWKTICRVLAFVVLSVATLVSSNVQAQSESDSEASFVIYATAPRAMESLIVEIAGEEGAEALAGWGEIVIVGSVVGDKNPLPDEVASVLINCATEFFDTPLTDLVRGHTNLVAYMDRMKAAYFARNFWPTNAMA